MQLTSMVHTGLSCNRVKDADLVNLNYCNSFKIIAPGLRWFCQIRHKIDFGHVTACDLQEEVSKELV